MSTALARGTGKLKLRFKGPPLPASTFFQQSENASPVARSETPIFSPTTPVTPTNPTSIFTKPSELWSSLKESSDTEAGEGCGDGDEEKSSCLLGSGSGLLKVCVGQLLYLIRR